MSVAGTITRGRRGMAWSPSTGRAYLRLSSPASEQNNGPRRRRPGGRVPVGHGGTVRAACRRARSNRGAGGRSRDGKNHRRPRRRRRRRRAGPERDRDPLRCRRRYDASSSMPAVASRSPPFPPDPSPSRRKRPATSTARTAGAARTARDTRSTCVTANASSTPAITMWRFATISGTVTDDVDEPMSADGSGLAPIDGRRAMEAHQHGSWLSHQRRTTASTASRRSLPARYELVIMSLLSAMPASFADAAAAVDGPATMAAFLQDLQTSSIDGRWRTMPRRASPPCASETVAATVAAGAAPARASADLVQVYPTVRYPSACAELRRGPATRLDARRGRELHRYSPFSRRTSHADGARLGHVTRIGWSDRLRDAPCARRSRGHIGAEITSSPPFRSPPR